MGYYNHGKFTNYETCVFCDEYNNLLSLPISLFQLYHSIDRIDGPVVERSRDVFASATPIESIRGWTKDDIQNWKNKHELSQYL